MKAIILFTLFYFILMQPTYGIDKRLKLTFKTAGYGAATGAALGAGAWAFGVGYNDYRNVLLGASLGMYAGILLAAYIVFVPDKETSANKNPFAPRKPIGPEDWEEESQEYWEQEMLRKQEESSFNKSKIFAKPIAWLPVFQFRF